MTVEREKDVEMNMPGYTADASLYLSSRPYVGSTFAASSTDFVYQASPRYPVCERTCGCDTYDFSIPYDYSDKYPTCAKLCWDRPKGLPYAVLCDPKECNPPCQPPPALPPSTCVKGPNCVAYCLSQCPLSPGACAHDCDCCCNGTPCITPGNPPGCCLFYLA
jgi:hypothetical protein